MPRLIRKPKTSSDFLIHIFFLIILAGLVGGFLFILNEVRNLKNDKTVNTNTITNTKEIIIEKTPAPSLPTAKPLITTKDLSKKITYINLNGSLTTVGTDWIDIPSTDVSINTLDYGKDAYVDWEASVLVSSFGNKVQVRLYDTTNKISINGSGLTGSQTDNSRISSGRLYFWRGQNNYRVQIKSLNGQPVTFNSGKIKIVY